MPDSLFAHSVILMLPLSATEAPIVAGVIVNKPTKLQVKEIFPNAASLGRQASKAFFGGPVEPNEPWLVIREDHPGQNATHVFENVYVATDPHQIADKLKRHPGPDDLRVILGRSQWTRDQLQAEIMEGSWYIMPAKSDLVFSSDPDKVWRRLVSHARLLEVEWTPDAESAGPGAMRYPGDQPQFLLLGGFRNRITFPHGPEAALSR